MDELRTEMEAKGMFKFAQADDLDRNSSSIRVGFKCNDEADREWAISKLQDAFDVSPVNPVGAVDGTGYVSLIVYEQAESDKIMAGLGLSASWLNETQVEFRNASED